MRIIDKNTVIPISMVGSIIGGSVWLTSLWFQTSANAKAIHDVNKIISNNAMNQERKQEQSELFQKEVLQRLSRIESKIENPRFR